MNYKKEIGARIQRLRMDRGWSLADLSRRCNDLLSRTRINNYETGYRMPGPEDAVVLAQALESRPAYILAVDDIQIAMSSLEETLVKNWRILNERDRMAFFRRIEQAAMMSRDPVPDAKLQHLSAKGKARAK